jgi:hypothetical protein
MYVTHIQHAVTLTVDGGHPYLQNIIEKEELKTCNREV